MKEEKKVLKDVRRLFGCAKKNSKMAKRYVQLAKKMAMRYNVKVPKELKEKYCHKCFSVFNSKNSEVRIKRGMKTIKCLECGNCNRIRLDKD